MSVLENRDLWVRIAELIASIAQGGGGSGVKDVKVNDVSVVLDGVANIPLAASQVPGVARVDGSNGVAITAGGALEISGANDTHIKQALSQVRPIVPYRQHMAVFYGLAKASGDDTQSASANAVGTYTDDAKQSIKEMLGITCFIPVTYESDAYTSDFDYDDIVALVGKGCYCVAVLDGEYIPLTFVDTANSEINFISTTMTLTNIISHAIIFASSGISGGTMTYTLPTNQ